MMTITSIYVRFDIRHVLFLRDLTLELGEGVLAWRIVLKSSLVGGTIKVR